MRRFATVWLAVFWIVLQILEAPAALVIINPPAPGAGSGLALSNGNYVVTNAGGAIVVAPGTNSVPITNANPAQLIITAPTNILAVHTIDTNGNSVIAFSATSDIPGPQGAPGAGNLQFYGNWVTNTPYGTNIIAVYGGQAYYTTRGVTSPTPPSADTTNWAIFAQAGDDGSNGTSGTNGLDGVGLVYRGTWAGGNLTTNDIVSYLGTSYVPLRDLTPSDQPDTSTNYVVFVARGTDGASGNVVSNLFFLGDWVISTVYPSNSVVGYGGRVYYANKTASNYVTLAPSINSDFTLLIDEGADGTDGDDGLNGVSLVYDNCYDASKVYVSNVVVTYPCTGKKNLYRATGAGGPVVGVTPPSDASKWEEIISSGADADVQTFAFYSSYTTNIVYSNAWVKYVNGTVYYSLSTVPAGAGPLDTNYWAVVVTNGANGAAGASGTNGMNGLNGSAGPTNMQFMGSWVGGTFTTNQLVTWSGVTYFVNTASTTSRPPASGWDIFVDRGPEGPQGTNYTTYYTNVITYVYLTNQIVTNISYVTNTFNYTNVAYTSIITVVTNTYTATNVYASVEAYSDSVNGLRTSPSNSSVLQYCLTNDTAGAGGGDTFATNVLNAVADVGVTGAETNQPLCFDGVNWTNCLLYYWTGGGTISTSSPVSTNYVAWELYYYKAETNGGWAEGTMTQMHLVTHASNVLRDVGATKIGRPFVDPTNNLFYMPVGYFSLRVLYGSDGTSAGINSASNGLFLTVNGNGADVNYWNYWNDGGGTNTGPGGVWNTIAHKGIAKYQGEATLYNTNAANQWRIIGTNGSAGTAFGLYRLHAVCEFLGN